MGPFLSFLLLFGISLGFALLLIRNVRKASATLRQMNEVKTTLIRYLETGMNEVAGVVSEKSTPILSFLEEKECVYIDVEIFELRRTGRSTSYESIFRYIDQGTCILEDESGACVVDLEPSKIDLTLVLNNGKHISEISDEARERLALLDESPTEKLRSKRKLHFKEHLLCAGEELYVLGDMQVSDTDEMRHIQMNPALDPPKKLFVTNRKEEEAAINLKKRIISHGIIAVMLLFFAGLFAYMFVKYVFLT